MLKRRHINADPRGRSARFLLAIADIARWPFERCAWLLERRLIWPLRERAAGRARPGRTAGAGALGAVVVAAVLVGVLLLPRGDGTSDSAAETARVAIVTPQPEPHAEEPQGPVLKGVPPSFGVGKGVGLSKTASDAADELNAGSPTTESESSETSAPEQSSDAAAETSSIKPVPAGPAAMKVARRFAEAFVFYEVGERPERAKTVFVETATPQLATALEERPPRQPEDAKVPKARVVNLVPGPRAGQAYTVSVALLRVGLTTELRLELNEKDGAWVVTDVRG